MGVTLGCCFGLILMVCVFWAVSRPTETDRMVNYMSLKRMKRERRKSSLSVGAGDMPNILNQSLDRSLKDSLAAQTNDDSSRSNGAKNGHGATTGYDYNQLKSGSEAEETYQ